MNDVSTQGSLELEVTDFGPIARATVDLRPLTVFVGPSNTGKSYLAILIYALHRVLSREAGSAHLLFPRIGPIVRGRRSKKLDRKIIDALGKMPVVMDNPDFPNKGSIVLPSPVADEIRSGFKASGQALVGEIIRCFGVDEANALTRRGQRNNARIVLRRCIPDNPAQFEHELTLARKETELSTTIPAERPIRIMNLDPDSAVIEQIKDYVHQIQSVQRHESEERELVVWGLMAALPGLVLPHIVGPLCLPAYYLPADRTGVMHAHSVVVSALIGSAPTAALRPTPRTPMLSGVLADFLEQILEIDRPGRSRSIRTLLYEKIDARIEEAILGGSVRVDRSPSIGYPRFTYRPRGWKDALPLMNASSMVSELAPVVLYLRHVVEPDNVLIIEEPESHLHPAMQVEFTRQLAALVNAGTRVIVTTHSEWLLEELANIVRRSEVPQDDHKTRADGRKVTLDPDMVGAWLFKPNHRPKGSVVQEIRLDDSGLYSSGFDEVAATLHNDWAEISSRIEGDS